MNIALFFGSFNPIHNGHIHIANHILKNMICNEVWFVISPQNPLKKDYSLLNEELRLELASKAIKDYSNMNVCNIEFSLPKPSYTYKTLIKLKYEHPEKNFHLIIGSDNLDIFKKWKNYDKIIEEFKLIVYPRTGSAKQDFSHTNIIKLRAELKNISSTEIRNRVMMNKNISTFVPDSILKDVISYYSPTRS